MTIPKEEAWLRLFCAACTETEAPAERNAAYADAALKEYEKRFPPPADRKAILSMSHDQRSVSHDPYERCFKVGNHASADCPLCHPQWACPPPEKEVQS